MTIIDSRIRTGRWRGRRQRRSETAVPVLYVARSGKIGGANRIFMQLMTGLDAARFTPYLVSPSYGGLTDWAEEAGVPWQVIPDGDLDGRVGLAKRVLPLALAARSVRARLLHAIDPACYRAAGFAARLAGAARVCHVHLPENYEELLWTLRSGPELLLTCYEAQADDVRRALGGSKPGCRVLAVPNAVDLARFAPCRTSESEAYRFGGQQVVLIVGHLSEVKGYPAFLRACADIQPAFPGCEFVALGGETIASGYRAELEQMAFALGIRDRTHFLGWRTDVPNVINAADVVVMPSLNEGLPLAVLEAMACGKPVIATPVGGIPEAVVDGVTGLVVPPQSPGKLAAAMSMLLAAPELAADMGAAARLRAERVYSLSAFVGRIQGLYETVLEESGRLSPAPDAMPPWRYAQPSAPANVGALSSMER